MLENFFNSRTLIAISSVYWGLKAREVISGDYSHGSKKTEPILPLCASASASEATSSRKTSLSCRTVLLNLAWRCRLYAYTPRSFAVHFSCRMS